MTSPPSSRTKTSPCSKGDIVPASVFKYGSAIIEIHHHKTHINNTKNVLLQNVIKEHTVIYISYTYGCKRVKLFMSYLRSIHKLIQFKLIIIGSQNNPIQINNN